MSKIRPLIGIVNHEQIEQQEKVLQQKIEKLQQQSINESLAETFPDWDLNPPTMLIRRKGNKHL